MKFPHSWWRVVGLCVLSASLMSCGGKAIPVPGAIVNKKNTEIFGMNLIGISLQEKGSCSAPSYSIPIPPGLADPDQESRDDTADQRDDLGQSEHSPAQSEPTTIGSGSQDRLDSGDTNELSQDTQPDSPLADDPMHETARRAHRIVVAGDSLIDGLCALGLGDRVVGRIAASSDQDALYYLGPQIAALPTLGTAGSVPIENLRALHPDAIFVPSDLASDLEVNLPNIAPVIAVPSSSPRTKHNWKDSFLELGALVGKTSDALEQLDRYHEFLSLQRDSETLDPAHTQASVVRLIHNEIHSQGTDSFAGSVLFDLGVDRPPSQQSGDTHLLSTDSLATADGDVIYVSIAEPDSVAAQVISSSAWRSLGSVKAKQVFAVHDQWWFHGGGPIAAANMIIDVVGSLNTPPPP